MFESTELPLRIGGNVLMATADNADPPGSPLCRVSARGTLRMPASSVD